MIKKTIYLIIVISFGTYSCKNIKGMDVNNNELNFEREFELAVELLENGQLNKAEEKFLLLDNKFNNVGIKMNLAQIELNRGDNSKAVTYAKSALQIDPNNIAIVRFLESLTNDTLYTKSINNLDSKIIKVSSEQYFLDFRNESSIVNTEYAKFKIEITGEIVLKENQIIYLNGASESKEESVICWQTPPETYEESQIGDTITFIGTSFGIGEDLSEPIIVYKEEK